MCGARPYICYLLCTWHAANGVNITVLIVHLRTDFGHRLLNNQLDRSAQNERATVDGFQGLLQTETLWPCDPTLGAGHSFGPG